LKATKKPLPREFVSQGSYALAGELTKADGDYHIAFRNYEQLFHPLIIGYPALSLHGHVCGICTKVTAALDMCAEYGSS
jgi:hypothetical protein